MLTLKHLNQRILKKRNELFKTHALAVRNQVNQLSTKEYWGQFEKSPDFVVMFIPGESFLGVAAQMIPNLIESSISKKSIDCNTSYTHCAFEISCIWMEPTNVSRGC